MNNWTAIALCSSIAILIITVGLLREDKEDRRKMLDSMRRAVDSANEAIRIMNEQNLTFEADGVEVDPLEDGRVRVTFNQVVGKPIEGNGEEVRVHFRRVICPSWIFHQAIAEGSLKSSFEALDKREKALEAREKALKEKEEKSGAFK